MKKKEKSKKRARKEAEHKNNRRKQLRVTKSPEKTSGTVDRLAPGIAADAAKVKLSPQNGQGQPSLNTRHKKAPLGQKPQSPHLAPTTKPSWIWWLTGWRLFVELATVLALAIALYASRPVLSVASYGTSDHFGTTGLKIVVANSGLKIKQVSVKCVTNKLVFEDRYTLDLGRMFAIDEYAVPDVATGESFTADCAFSWSMWMRPSDGFFIWGAGASHENGAHLAIPFFIRDGKPFLDPNVPSPGRLVGALSSDYSKKELTSMDASYVISYKWPIVFPTQERIIHAITQRTLTDPLAWKIVPESEATIPDGSLPGFKIKYTGAMGPGKKWSFELRHNLRGR